MLAIVEIFVYQRLGCLHGVTVEPKKRLSQLSHSRYVYGGGVKQPLVCGGRLDNDVLIVLVGGAYVGHEAVIIIDNSGKHLSTTSALLHAGKSLCKIKQRAQYLSITLFQALLFLWLLFVIPYCWI